MIKKKFRSLKKRLIIQNRYLIRYAEPRTRVADENISFSYKGGKSMDSIRKDSKDIFSGFSSLTDVMIKINLNSSFPYPASVSLEMLDLIIDCLQNIGVKRICVADSSGLSHIPTSEVMEAKGLKNINRPGVKIKSLDFAGWRRVPIGGKYFSEILVSKEVYGYDRIINLSNLKSHSLSGFSAATKNLVGLMHPYQRFELHRDHLVERIAEIPLAVEPDINIIDARSVFIDGGPDTGSVYNPDSVVIESDLLKADLAAYDLLVNAKKENGISNLPENHFKNPFFIHKTFLSGDLP